MSGSQGLGLTRMSLPYMLGTFSPRIATARRRSAWPSTSSTAGSSRSSTSRRSKRGAVPPGGEARRSASCTRCSCSRPAWRRCPACIRAWRASSTGPTIARAARAAGLPRAQLRRPDADLGHHRARAVRHRARRVLPLRARNCTSHRQIAVRPAVTLPSRGHSSCSVRSAFVRHAAASLSAGSAPPNGWT